MRVLVCVLLFAALSAAQLCSDNCDEPCSTDEQEEVCVFRPEEGCFIKYENCCAWKEIKCKNNLDHQVFLNGFCDLENFECREPSE